ncbi:MAG TPA: hypothetical protein VHP64_00970 [Candidatus Limnocylindria bacterium]|nr:hypothetical protein [Candidatus Limnocylindria bacterium]
MSGIRLSRVALALLIIVVLIGGVVLGSVVTAVATPSPTLSPTPSMSMAPDASGLPTADVSGDDLERLPRYPGSVRTEYEISVDDRFRLVATEYLADASMDEVRSFYQGAIEDYGWQRADINYSGDEWTYVLVDGSTEALIEIEVTGGYVEIDLQISTVIATPTPEPTPSPTTTPTAPPPAPPAPTPTDDDGGDDDDDNDDTGGGDDDDVTDG